MKATELVGRRPSAVDHMEGRKNGGVPAEDGTAFTALAGPIWVAAFGQLMLGWANESASSWQKEVWRGRDQQRACTEYVLWYFKGEADVFRKSLVTVRKVVLATSCISHIVAFFLIDFDAVIAILYEKVPHSCLWLSVVVLLRCNQHRRGHTSCIQHRIKFGLCISGSLTSQSRLDQSLVGDDDDFEPSFMDLL